MNVITEKEMLALLGYADAPRSYDWYSKHYPEAPELIKNYISCELNKYQAFPKEVVGMESRSKCTKFYYTIEVGGDGYIVSKNNTDRGEVLESKTFTYARDAADYLIGHSFGAGGAIKKYWNLRPNENEIKRSLS